MKHFKAKGKKEILRGGVDYNMFHLQEKICACGNFIFDLES
jgi:hypothetical protein